MDVRFIANQKGNVVIPCPEIGDRHSIVFVRGRKTTSDKREIRKLLSDSYCIRNTKLAPGQDPKKIDEYLSSDDRPDVMTKEFLDNIPFEAYRDIIPAVSDIKVQFPLVGIAKATLEGKPMNIDVERIAEEWAEKLAGSNSEPAPKPKPKPKVAKIKVGAKSTDETSTEGTPDENPKTDKKSSDGNVVFACGMIEKHAHEYLRDFLAEDEARVTVLRAWNEKFPEHAVEMPG